MEYPMLYYRTSTTTYSTPGYTTPALLLQNAPTQCIVFKRPNSSLDNIAFSFDNNLNYYQAISNDGTRLINLQDNGMNNQTLNLNGLFTVTNGNADIGSLFNMSRSLQTDQGFLNGKFGFYSPNATFFNLDPFFVSGIGQGYSIKKLDINRVTKIPNLYMFNIVLGFSGTR